MMRFALEEREMLELVALVRPGADAIAMRSGTDEDASDRGGSGSAPNDEGGTLADVAEAFARIAWTVLAEPGDEDAGRVLAGLGAATALDLLLAGVDEDGFRGALLDAGGAEPLRDLATSLARWAPRLSARSVVRAIEQSARFDAALVLPDDEDWPVGLAGLGYGAPTALWIRGDRARLAMLGRSVAIVGARAATGYGEHVAAELAVGVAERGVAVLSGGAYGIDRAAHRGTLAVDGLTAAILAGGLDRLYPAGNEQLFHRIIERGLMLAEVPCGVPPTKFRFLARNRLLAAIAQGVVVVEAGVRSGSINTAGHAAQIGRPIGAVPGPVTSPASAGCHRLLREFPAVCVTGVDDVMAMIGEAAPFDEEPFLRPDDRILRVLDALRPRKARAALEIARLAGLAEPEVLAVLGPLELAGRVRRGELGWTLG